MTRFDEPFKVERREPQTDGEFEACAYVKTLFGFQAASVRSISGNRARQEICLVKASGLLDPSIEFIIAGGLLVGIPPKRLGEK